MAEEGLALVAADTATRFKGVCKTKKGKFQVQIKQGGKRHIGQYAFV